MSPTHRVIAESAAFRAGEPVYLSQPTERSVWASRRADGGDGRFVALVDVEPIDGATVVARARKALLDEIERLDDKVGRRVAEDLSTEGLVVVRDFLRAQPRRP